jgi:hypothetical protein
MVRRSGNTIEDRKRRLPYVAKIKRDDPFRPQDLREIEAACRRIAAASEHMSLAGWRQDAGYRVFHFATWAKARAMQHWIDRTRIAHRPMPKLGESKEELLEAKRDALAWAFNTGAVAPIVRTFVRHRAAGEEELTSFNATCDLARLLGRPTGEVQRTVYTVLEWAREHHPDWFAALEPKGTRAGPPARQQPARPQPARRARPPEPPPPSWKPRF